MENEGERAALAENAYAEISRYDEQTIIARWEGIIQAEILNDK